MRNKADEALSTFVTRLGYSVGIWEVERNEDEGYVLLSLDSKPLLKFMRTPATTLDERFELAQLLRHLLCSVNPFQRYAQWLGDGGETAIWFARQRRLIFGVLQVATIVEVYELTSDEVAKRKYMLRQILVLLNHAFNRMQLTGYG